MKDYEFVRAESANFAVRELCDNLEVSRSAYYEWLAGREPGRRRQDRALTARIRAIFQRSRRRYGAPRVQRALREQGVRVARKRVARLMREGGMIARPRRRFRRTTDSSHGLPVAPDLLGRDFHADAPNTVWAGDITYIWTAEGWCYLAVLLDLFSRRVVGWKLSSSLSRELALEALEQAVKRRQPPPGLIHHTDRGCQYASAHYRARLEALGMRASMSGVGDCWDNAVSETFFATLKKELVHGCAFATRTEAYDVISDYIENFYNAERLHSTIGYVSPNDFELHWGLAQAA